jgi:NADPH:quinone reductase-like Zn-dependent oxidoreductase
MQAIVYHVYGPPEVLALEEIPKPVPKSNEILIKVYATTVNFGDLMARNFKNVTPRQFNMPGLLYWPARITFGLNKPKKKILGNEFAGVIESVGTSIQNHKPGEEVFGYVSSNFGCYAEYLLTSAKVMIASKPKHFSFEEAACIPYGAVTALNLLKKGAIRPNQKVLVNGASGGIGAAAVQLLKHYYGAEVTGVCGSPRHDFVKALGADHVIDYHQENFWEGTTAYDLIFDVLGRADFQLCKKVLSEKGILMCASFKGKQLLQMLTTKFSKKQKVLCVMSPYQKEDIEVVRKWMEEEKLKAPIDQVFTLQQTAEAHRYAESGMKTGYIAIRISG